MSKHQICPGCYDDFVGSDSNIGENFCPECHKKIHKGFLEQIEKLEIENAKLKNLLNRGMDILEDWKKLVIIIEKKAYNYDNQTITRNACR